MAPDSALLAHEGARGQKGLRAVCSILQRERPPSKLRGTQQLLGEERAQGLQAGRSH